jgi:predicted transposase/invertase (TIGR01784 family)
LFEKSKELPKDEIEDITYLSAEKLGRSASERRAIFDVYCTTKSGAKFIVEMQNVFQQFFKDRSLYYSSFPIQEMAKKDSKDEHWNYELNKIYTVGILNFVFKEDELDEVSGDWKTVNEFTDDDLLHVVMLVDVSTGKVFYRKLAYIYLEMPKFCKTESQLVTMYDKWLFALKNLSKLLERPKELQERVFEKLFRQAEIAMFTAEEYSDYEISLHSLWDITNAMNDAEAKGYGKGKEAGLEEGRAEGAHQQAIDTARRMLAKGMSIEDICVFTNLAPDEISKIR